MKAQVSAELLILLAASAAFFAVIAPAARDAAEAAKAGLVAKQQEAALEEISELAATAALMKGSVLQTRVFLAADSEIEADGKKIFLRFKLAGEEKGLRESASGLRAGRMELERGSWNARAEGGRLEFSRRRERD